MESIKSVLFMEVPMSIFVQVVLVLAAVAIFIAVFHLVMTWLVYPEDLSDNE